MHRSKRSLLGLVALLAALSAALAVVFTGTHFWAVNAQSQSGDNDAPDPATVVSLAVSAEGLITWQREEPQVPGQVYLLRWVSGESPPGSAADAPDRMKKWIAETDCGAATCEFQVPDFDSDRHYLVEVRQFYGDGDKSWQPAAYPPAGSTEEPPDPGTPEPETPGVPEFAVEFTSNDPTEIKLSWNAVEGARVYRIQDPEGERTTEETELLYRNQYP